MNTETLSDRKINLAVQIFQLDDERSVRDVENFIKSLRLKGHLSEKQFEILKEISKPIKEKLDINEVIAEQNWKPSTKEEIDEIIKNINFDESEEEFIEMLKDI